MKTLKISATKLKSPTEEDLKKLREKYDWESNTEESEKLESEEKKRMEEQKKKEKEAAENEQKKIEDYHKNIARLRSIEISALNSCGTALLASGVIVTDTRGNVLNYITNSSDLRYECVDFIAIEEEVQEMKEQARKDGVPMRYLGEW